MRRFKLDGVEATHPPKDAELEAMEADMGLDEGACHCVHSGATGLCTGDGVCVEPHQRFLRLARGKPSREELKEIEGMQWQDWTPRPLPEGLSHYFKTVPGAVTVPLGQLTPIRAREKGVANANRFMWLAYWGAKARRKPISLRQNRDGTYTVLDGNSTFANAKMSGWKHLLGVVEEVE